MIEVLNFSFVLQMLHPDVTRGSISRLWLNFILPTEVVSTFTGRKSFGSVLDIIPLADSITKLTARCEICGKSALFTLRKTQDTQVELIGGVDVYMPVCRQHYVSGQVAVEAARHVLESQKVECGSHT